MQHVSWFPLDRGADAIIEVGLARSLYLPQALHLFHPRPTPWRSIANELSQALSSLFPSQHQKPVTVAPFSEWIGLLEANAVEFRGGAALKLLPLFKGIAAAEERLRNRFGTATVNYETFGIVSIATEKMEALSPTMRSIPSMEDEGGHPTRWVHYWHSRGFIPSRSELPLGPVQAREDIHNKAILLKSFNATPKL